MFSQHGFVMTPMGPMLVGGGGYAGYGGGGMQIVMGPYGPMIVQGGANQMQCKHCFQLMDKMWDLKEMTNFDAGQHKMTCERRQEYDAYQILRNEIPDTFRTHRHSCTLSKCSSRRMITARCDLCSRSYSSSPSYTCVLCCESCDFDMCGSCYNEARAEEARREEARREEARREEARREEARREEARREESRKGESRLKDKRLRESRYRLTHAYYSRRGSTRTPDNSEREERERCARIETTLKSKSPYAEVRFEKLITPKPTGQAIVMRGTFQTSKKVAIKIYLEKGTDDFQNEVRILKKVGTHRHITPLLKEFTHPRDALLLPFAERGSLKSLVEERAFPNALVLQYAKHVADGLCYIHSRGVAHLDLKADNILITQDNVAQINDFGLSATFNGKDEIQGKGTIGFIAPEGLRSLGRRSDASKMDVYAFGMVMYEMLSGKSPYEEFWEGDCEAFDNQVVDKVLAGEAPGIDRRWAGTTVSIMKKCWQMQPEKRPSMIEIKSQL